MSPVLKAAVMLGGAYVLTLGVAGVLGGLYMVVTGPHSCQALGRALLFIWGIMAAAAGISTLAVAIVVWRLTMHWGAKLAFTAGYAVAVGCTFAVLGAGLLVVFNC